MPPTSGITGGSLRDPDDRRDLAQRLVPDPPVGRGLGGLTNETYRDVIPLTSTMTLATNPTGLQVTLDGQPLTAPQNVIGVVSIIAHARRAFAAELGGNAYNFVSWSDGGAQTHDISTPPTTRPTRRSSPAERHRRRRHADGDAHADRDLTPTRTPTARRPGRPTATPDARPRPRLATATRTPRPVPPTPPTRTPTRTSTATRRPPRRGRRRHSPPTATADSDADYERRPDSTATRDPHAHPDADARARLAGRSRRSRRPPASPRAARRRRSPARTSSRARRRDRRRRRAGVSVPDAAPCRRHRPRWRRARSTT